VSALTGIKTLEICHSVSGEYCAKLLADFGTEVTKLEPPVHGSPTRQMAPIKSTLKDSDSVETSGLFAYLNSNKQSLALDVKDSRNQAVMKKLLAAVDILITDCQDAWLPGVADDVHQLSTEFPRLIICTITDFGVDFIGQEVATDLTLLHSSGWGYHTPSAADNSRPPLKGPGRFLVSYEAALDAAMCISAALCDRENSGLGQVIDISKQAVMASRTDYVLGQMIAGDMNVSNDRRAYDLAGPADIYPCRDGFIYIWMSAPSHWQALGELMGQPAWMNDFAEDWLEKQCTPENVAVCREHLGAWLLTQNKTEFADLAQRKGLTVVPVNNTGDLLSCEQYQFREFFQTLNHPVLGQVHYPTAPYRMSKTPVQLRTAAPLLGADTDRLMSQLENSGGGL